MECISRLSIIALIINLSCFLYTASINEKEAKQILLSSISELKINKHNPTNQKGQADIKCNLTRTERDNANLQYPDTFYEYYNAILEINYSKNKMSKLTQDLLMESIRHNNTLSLLLGIQLYFSKQCERCERVRDISNFDYFRNKQVAMKTLLHMEGGSFKESYALVGEAFLCRGLERKDSNDLLIAYANLMMAGLHTRAINALIESIYLDNNDMSFETFHFLVSFDSVLPKNLTKWHLLGLLRAQHKKSNFNIMQYLHIFNNLEVLEYGIESSYTIQAIIMRDLEMGRILSPFDKFSNQDTIKEFWNKYNHYEQAIQDANHLILSRANVKELQEYYKILLLKQRLKNIKLYKYATTYRR